MCYPQASCLHLSGRKALKLLFQISRLFRSSCHLYQLHSSMSKWFSTSVSFSSSPTLSLSLSYSPTLLPVSLHCVSRRPSPLSLLSLSLRILCRPPKPSNNHWDLQTQEASSGKYSLVNKKTRLVTPSCTVGYVCTHRHPSLYIRTGRWCMSGHLLLVTDKEQREKTEFRTCRQCFQHIIDIL